MEPNNYFQLRPRQCFRLHRHQDSKVCQFTYNPFYSVKENQMKFQTLIELTRSASDDAEATTKSIEVKKDHASKEEASTFIFRLISTKLSEGYQLWQQESSEEQEEMKQEVVELGKRRPTQEYLDEDKYKKVQITQEIQNFKNTEEYVFSNEVKIYQNHDLDEKSELSHPDETDVALSNSGMTVEEFPFHQKGSVIFDDLESIAEELNEDENSENVQPENNEEEIPTVILDDDDDEEEEEVYPEEPFLEDELALALPYNKENVDGWYVAELVDGIRCYWDGNKLWASCGTELKPPRSFTQLLLKKPLDGVLYTEKYFLTINDPMFRKSKPSAYDWTKLRFLVYDAPGHVQPFQERLEALKKERMFNDSIYFKLAPYEQTDLQEYSDQLQKDGAVGFVMKDPEADYTPGKVQGFFERQFNTMQRSAIFIKAELDEQGNKSLHVQDNETGAGLIVSNDVPNELDVNSLKLGETILYRFKGGCFTRERKQAYFLGVQ